MLAILAMLVWGGPTVPADPATQLVRARPDRRGSVSGQCRLYPPRGSRPILAAVPPGPASDGAWQVRAVRRRQGGTF
jgi:hypothetical protein